MMSCVDDAFGTVHDDAAQSTPLLVGTNRDTFDIAGVESDVVVTQGPSHDGGEPHQGLIVVDKENVHSGDRMHPVVRSERRSERGTHQSLRSIKLVCAEFPGLGYQHLHHGGMIS